MTTKAIVLEKGKKGSKAFNLQEWPIAVLLENQVLIESEAFGLNYADVMASQGLYREAPPRPCVIGYEVVGTIIQVGSNLSIDWIGKRVLAFCRFGGYAKQVITEEYAFTEVGKENVGELLALCTQGVTAYYMSQYLSPIRKNDRVLIHAAAGGVGTLLIQMVKNAGGTVYAKIGGKKKEKLVRSLGADYVIDYQTSDYEKQLVELLKDERLDVSFNPVAGDTFKKDFRLLGSNGRIFLFGGSQLSSGKWGIFSALNFLRKMGRPLPIGLMMRSKAILGVNMLKVADHKPHVMKECLTSVYEMYQTGKIYPQIGGGFPVEKIQEAHELLSSGTSEGKIFVTW